MCDPIDPRVDIGHVHLKVADIDRALDFWCGVLGFELQQKMGDSAAFVSAGGYHHHLGLNTWQSKGGSSPPPGTTGLFHVAIRYPDRSALADALRRLVEAGIPLEGASDHGVSEAIYLRDPMARPICLASQANSCDSCCLASQATALPVQKGPRHPRDGVAAVD